MLTTEEGPTNVGVVSGQEEVNKTIVVPLESAVSLTIKEAKTSGHVAKRHPLLLKIEMEDEEAEEAGVVVVVVEVVQVAAIMNNHLCLMVPSSPLSNQRTAGDLQTTTLPMLLLKRRYSLFLTR